MPETTGSSAPAPPAGPATAPPVAPLDPPMLPFAAAGTAAWAVAGLVLLVLAGPFDRHVDERWLWMCLAGVLLGILGTLVMIRHDRARARRRATGDGPR